MPLDQRPVYGFIEQRINVAKVSIRRRSEKQQVFPVAYARHELDAEQMSEGKDGGGLAMSIGMDCIRLDA